MKIEKTAENKHGKATRVVDAPLTLKQIGPVRRVRQPIDGDEFCFALKGIKDAEQTGAQYRYWVY